MRPDRPPGQHRTPLSPIVPASLRPRRSCGCVRRRASRRPGPTVAGCSHAQWHPRSVVGVLLVRVDPGPHVRGEQLGRAQPPGLEPLASSLCRGAARDGWHAGDPRPPSSPAPTPSAHPSTRHPRTFFCNRSSTAGARRAAGARLGAAMGAAVPRHQLGRAPPIASTGHQAERRACHPACTPPGATRPIRSVLAGRPTRPELPEQHASAPLRALRERRLRVSGGSTSVRRRR